MDTYPPKTIENTANRWLALDVLRGLSIFGMLFSAIVPTGILPGWMYHVQNPAPLHTLNSAIPGISWVDWVFPLFIFCMGAAIPLAGRRRVEKRGQFFSRLLKRFLLLWAFAYLVTLLDPSQVRGKLDLMIPFSFYEVHVSSYDVQAIVLIGFLALFALFHYVKPSSKRIWIRAAGVCVILGIIALFHFGYGVPFDLHRRDFIILLLAFLYLFGSLIWYVTRDCTWGRLVFLAGVIGISFLSKETGFDLWLNAHKSASWIFNMEEIYYLLLLIPATWVGDYMGGYLGWRGQKDTITESPPVGHLFYILLGMLLVFLCLGLYLRWNEWILVGVSLSVLLLCLIISRNSSRNLFPLIVLAATLLLIGLLMDPYEGGIKKVPATFSYCLTMGGISMILLLFFHYICRLLPGSFFVRTLSRAGANPLISYLLVGSCFVPLLNLTFLIDIYKAAFPPESPWIGACSAFIFGLLIIYLVSNLSRKGIFWRV